MFIKARTSIALSTADDSHNKMRCIMQIRIEWTNGIYTSECPNMNKKKQICLNHAAL